jgi:hypothetical protein
MSKPNPLSIYKLLPKTNCRDCALPSCMAFAHALLSQDITLDACAHLTEQSREALEPILDSNTPQEGFRDTIEALRAEVRLVDLAAIAQGLGGRYEDGRLYIKCLGRDFIVLDNGTLESACHVNVWVELMLLNYCAMRGKGTLSGNWVAYGELPSAAPTAPYFEKRTEEPLRAIADGHTDVFMDMLEIFGGVEVEGFEADYAYIAYPLPKVPFLFLYTKQEGSFESRFKILLDSSVVTYVPKEAVTYMGRGIVEMFKRIVSKHQDHVSSEILFL